MIISGGLSKIFRCLRPEIHFVFLIIRDYEKYAGIHFAKRLVQEYTLQGKLPPNPYNYNTEEECLASFAKKFIQKIVINDILPEKDYDFWYIGIGDGNEKEIFRKDLQKDQIYALLNNSKEKIEFDFEFMTSQVPRLWTVWPHSVTKGWLQKISCQI